MNWEITYYSERVANRLKEWPKKLRAKLLRILDLMAVHGSDLGQPITRAMGNGLFEIRVKAQEGIGRVFFCFVINREIILLHSFIKKANETPTMELKIAIKRMKEVKT